MVTRVVLCVNAGGGGGRGEEEGEEEKREEGEGKGEEGGGGGGELCMLIIRQPHKMLRDLRNIKQSRQLSAT